MNVNGVKKHAFFLRSRKQPSKIRCSVCGKIVKENEVFEHARGCWPNRIDLLKVLTLCENESAEYILKDSHLTIYTPFFKKTENGRYIGAEWNVCYEADISKTNGEIENEQGTKTYEGFWKMQKLRSLEDFYLDPRVLEDVLDQYTKNHIEKRNKEKELGVSELLNIKNELDSQLFGQEDAKKQLSFIVYQFMKSEKKNRVVLLKGATGCGKTYMVESLKNCSSLKAKKMDIMFCDVSGLTAESFSGDSVSDIKKRSERFFFGKNDKKRIIFMDEFDKIFTMSNTDSNGENVNYTVQTQLLDFLQGSSSDHSTLFILAGAFSDFDKVQEREKKKNLIGFNREMEKEEDLSFESLNIKDKFLQSGNCLAELVGRIDSIIQLHSLTRNEYEKIFERSFDERRANYADFGIFLKVTVTAKDYMIEKLINNKLGARAVESALNDVLKAVVFDCFEQEQNVITITFDKDKGRLVPALSEEKTYEKVR